MRSGLIAVTALVAGAFVGGEAFAQTSAATLVKTYTENVTVTATNNTNVRLSKDVDVKKVLQFLGVVEIEGTVNVDASGMSTIDSKQVINDNSVVNLAADPTDNEATLSSAVTGATGNIGINISAGDNNVQQNAAALTIVGSAAGGGADAEIFLYQESFNNDVGPTQTTGFSLLNNTSTVSGGSFDNTSGNIGVNVATGVFNAQHNALALSTVVAAASLAEASVGSIQQATFNTTQHSLTDNIALVDAALTTASGNVGLNVTAGSNNMQSNALSMAVQ